MKKMLSVFTPALFVTFSAFLSLFLVQQRTAADEAGSGDLAEWTVMLYLCGTDLESEDGLATRNLEAIAKTSPVPEVNFVIETGGAKEWHTQDLGMDPDPSKLERWSYTDQGFQKVGEAELASMGEQGTLQDFLAWSKENYPAKKYQLILWDHGGASISGVVFDELHDMSSLQLFDIAGALEGADMHLESLMTDTCLMATLEMAEAAAPYASYFVGCEESLPGQGTNYTGFLQYLYDFPECSGVQYGKRICSSTEEMYSDLGYNADLGFLTISLIDLSKVSEIREAFDRYITEADRLLDDPAAFYEYCYATRNRESYAYKNFVDIYDLAERAAGHGISRKTAAELQNAVEDAVIYNISGSNHVRSHGLTVFYSFNENTYRLDHYSRVCSDPVYLAFLDRLSYKWKAPEWVYDTAERRPDVSSLDYAANAVPRVSEDGKTLYLAMPSEDSFVIEVSWELLEYDPDLDLWRSYGCDPFLAEENDGTELRLQGTFDGTWPALYDQLLTMEIADEQEEYVLFTTPLKVDGYTDNIRILYRPGEETEDPQYELIGSASLDDHTGFPDRNVDPVEAGSSLEPLAELRDLYGDAVLKYKAAESFIYYPDMQITREALPAGEYAVRFVVTDIFGNETRTAPVSCEWDGNSVIYEQS